MGLPCFAQKVVLHTLDTHRFTYQNEWVSNCQRTDSVRRMLERLFLPILLALGPAVSAAEDLVYYYCPRGNAQLVGNEAFLEGVAMDPFPSRLGRQVISRHRLHWDFTDCSDDLFMCYDVEEVPGKQSFRIFIPREIIVGEAYKHGAATALALGTTSTNPARTAQVVIWQKVDGESRPLKLTVQENKGLIFLDGIPIGAMGRGFGTCSLESTVGYFAGVQIKRETADSGGEGEKQ